MGLLSVLPSAFDPRNPPMPQQLPFDSFRSSIVHRRPPHPFVLYHRGRIASVPRPEQRVSPGDEGYPAVLRRQKRPRIPHIRCDHGGGGQRLPIAAALAELDHCERARHYRHGREFTSNNTTVEKFAIAAPIGRSINLEHPPPYPKQLQQLPTRCTEKMVSFRFQSGTGNGRATWIIGRIRRKPNSACTRDHSFEGLRACAPKSGSRVSVYTRWLWSKRIETSQALLQPPRCCSDLAIEIQPAAGVRTRLHFIQSRWRIGRGYVPSRV